LRPRPLKIGIYDDIAATGFLITPQQLNSARLGLADLKVAAQARKLAS
jgi:hypothetical protein